MSRLISRTMASNNSPPRDEYELEHLGKQKTL